MSAPDALVASLMEIERHVAGLGWDQPARLFALVPTVDVPAGRVVLASGPLPDGRMSPDTALWLTYD